MTPSRARLGVLLRLLFGVGGIVFLTLAFLRAWHRSRTTVLPSPWHLAGAAVLATGALVMGSRGWASLLERDGSERELTRAFYLGQLGKYVPGGVWQAVGQVGLSRRAGVSLSQAATAFPVHALTQAAAGGTVGATLVLAGSRVPLPVRLASLSGLVLVPLLRRAWVVRVVHLLGRLARRSWSESLVPAQEQILRSYAWGIGTLVCSGVAFALLASSVHAARASLAAVPAFALAWTAGFLAIPVPSGLGIREAVLIVTIGRAGGAAPVIAASIAHRLVTMIGEAVMILVSSRRRPLEDRP